MAVPTIDQFSDVPVPGDTDADFDTAAFTTVSEWGTIIGQINTATVYVTDQAEDALASAVAASAGSLDEGARQNFAGQVIGVEDATGYPLTGFDFLELVTPATFDNLTAGDVLYWDGTTLDRLPKGTAGQVLTQGASDAPEWGASLDAPSDATVYACRAWVNFDGTGTVAIRASGNVSSITDNGSVFITGDYTVNFDTAMPDADYSAVGTRSEDDSASTTETIKIVSFLSGSCRIRTNGINDNSNPTDATTVCLAIFR